MEKHKTAKYLIISKDLKRKLLNREFANGRLPSERELADNYGVNRLTLRKALKVLFDEGLVAKLGQKGTYSTEVDALLDNFRRKRVACVLAKASIKNSYFSSLLFHINRKLAGYGISSSVLIAETPGDLDPYIKENTVTSNFDGIILSGFFNADFIRKIKLFNKPFVMQSPPLESCEEEDNIDKVKIDISTPLYECIEYLISKGYSRTAFIDDLPTKWGLEAENSFVKAYADAGFPDAHKMVMRPMTSFGKLDPETLLNAFRSRHPDSVFIQSEFIAAQALFLLGNYIKDLPVIFIGHEGDSLSLLDFPKLELSQEEIAEKTLDLLIHRLALPGLPVQVGHYLPAFKNRHLIPEKRHNSLNSKKPFFAHDKRST